MLACPAVCHANLLR